jgi:hypothetical protein
MPRGPVHGKGVGARTGAGAALNAGLDHLLDGGQIVGAFFDGLFVYGWCSAHIKPLSLNAKNPNFEIRNKF